MSIPLPLIGVMAAIVGMGIYIIISSNKPKREQVAARKKLYGKLYGMFTSFFLTQGQALKISQRISLLSIYSREDVKELTTRYLLLTLGVSGGLVVASVILFRDVVSILICITLALVVNNTLVTKQVDKINIKIFKALKHSISSIRQEYLKLGSVSEAIANADIHKLLIKPFDEIYEILTGVEGELKLLKFYESSPFRSLQTLAGICYNIHSYGDGTDEQGQSNFLQALTMLASDVNSEIQRLTTMRSKFGMIEYLPLVPLFGISMIQNYFSSIMPGTALIYNGLLGHIGRVLTLVSTIVCYSVIASINTSTTIKEDDRVTFVMKWLENPAWEAFIKNISAKGKVKRKLERRIRDSLSKKTIYQLYSEKVVFAIGAFIVAFIIMISAINLSRDFHRNSTQQLSLIATDEMEQFTSDQILELDHTYFARTNEWTDEQYMENVRSHLPGLTDLQIIDQIKRIRDKETALLASYFHWYYVWIVFAISIIAFFIPNMLLLLRKFLVLTEADDDFLQIQTLVAILMNTEIDTLDTLWQMCQHSRIHKDILMQCYHSYPSDPVKELTRLQSKTPIIEFKRFIGKLMLTISDLSLKEAFSDLRLEREHMLKVRDISMYETIDKKRGLCGPLAMVPMGLLILFMLIIPLGYLGFREFMNALGGLG